MKTSLKLVLATSVVALTVVACEPKKQAETAPEADTTQVVAADTTPVAVDTAAVTSDTAK